MQDQRGEVRNWSGGELDQVEKVLDQLVAEPD